MLPDAATWLHGLPEPVLMRDVDRYVNELYHPLINGESLPAVIAECHRYVIDLNRKPDEFDAQAVEGAHFAIGTHPKGLHWSVTTLGEPLIKVPMSMKDHIDFVNMYYSPFHEQVQRLAELVKQQSGSKDIYHLDLHSMPSQGTAMHNDPGQKRADVVISDFHGKSARADFVDLVKSAYTKAGFNIAYNWPYFGGGITQMYGHPDKGHHTVQVELNRALYMNEDTKKQSSSFSEVQLKLSAAIRAVRAGLSALS